MLISHSAPIDLNVTLRVYDSNQKLIEKRKFKNTATKRLTQGIALFLAGDSTAQDTGRWRPNFVSFGTTGIDMQPYGDSMTAYVENPEAFSNPAPEEGFRTRPWYFSERLGERTDGFWDSTKGWCTDAENPNIPCFQGELATASTDPVAISRHQILRAEVTDDNSIRRDTGRDGYSSDCIFYGYSSVKWNREFFLPSPESGVVINRLAISEFGLYEGDSRDPVGENTLLAGFRVPTVDDIIYVEEDYVILLEWRVSIRALMPFESISIGTPAPTGIKVWVSTMDDTHIQMNGYVLGDIGVNPRIQWELSGNSDPTTEINEITGLITLGPNEESNSIQVTAISKANPEVYAVSAVLTGAGGEVTNIVTGIAISVISSTDRSVELHAQVLGKGIYSDEVTWSLDEPHHPGTTIDTQTGIITIDSEETETSLRILCTSVQDTEITSAAAIVQMNLVAGDYIVSDFSILTE